jgi:thiamine pyrophosphokinase
VIFTGGNPEPVLPKGLELGGAFVIAADSGYTNCIQLGVKPDLAVGDYDSLGFAPCDCERLTFPKEKDDTDLMLAIRAALERECTDITILGAMGGRFDHTFANIQTLAFILSHGAAGRILSTNERITLLSPCSVEIAAEDGFSLSLFSYGKSVSGLTIEGTKYTLCNGKIDNTFPIGISNEILGKSAHISFDEGLLIVVQSKL